MSAEPRRPQVFDPNDPVLIAEPEPVEDAAPTPDDTSAPEPNRPLARPTLADLGRKGWRWGALLVGALLGAATLGTAAWFARLVSAALVRDDWLGWTVTVLLLIAAFAALMLALREFVGLLRLARLSRLRTDVETAIRDKDRNRERRSATRLARLYAGRADVAWSLKRFREHARDVHDPGELLSLAEREIVVPLDMQARRLVTRSAKRVATVTALSPVMLIAVLFVLIENLALLRSLATLYGGRPAGAGVLKLARLVFAHVVATGGIAMTDDLLGQFLGQDLLRRLSRRLGEGAFNGALTARIGIAAMEVIRPLPYLSARAPRARDILGEALRPLFSKDVPV